MAVQLRSDDYDEDGGNEYGDREDVHLIVAERVDHRKSSSHGQNSELSTLNAPGSSGGLNRLRSLHVVPLTNRPAVVNLGRRVKAESLHDRANLNEFEQPLTQEKFDELHSDRRTAESQTTIRLDCACSAQRVAKGLLSCLPLIDVLRTYNLRTDLVRDFLAGLTVCVMHIPQGMAYGMLARLPPVYGLYSSIFPVLVYFLMGTSRHISVGTFAVVTLMVSSPVIRITDSLAEYHPNTTARSGSNSSSGWSYTVSTTPPLRGIAPRPSAQPGEQDKDNELLQFGDMVLTRAQCHVQVAIAVTLLTGLIQLGMAALRLGFLTIYMNQAMVNGFTTGAAFHVMTSQIVYVVGYKPSQHFTGPLKLIYIYSDIILNYEKFNSVSLAISLVCITILLFFKELVQPRVSKRTKLSIPIDLALIILGMMISYMLDLAKRYDVFTIGKIPSGFPPPQIPDVRIFRSLLTDCALIALVSYAITISMAKIFAVKHAYEVSPNQELLALGLSNVVSSFLNCHASSASLSRSLVQEGAGCRSQVASLVSCAGLVFVILFVAPLFETVPNCVLASIILVALKGLFLQLGELPKQWRSCKYDFAIWLVSFVATVLVDVDYGLVIGLLFSICTLLYRTQSCYACVLGQVQNTSVFEDMSVYPHAQELVGIKVFRFDGALHFASADNFRDSLQKKTHLPPSADYPLTRAAGVHDVTLELQGGVIPQSDAVHHLVIDCSAVNFIDSTGVKALATVFDECAQRNVSVLLAGTKANVRQAMDRLEFFKRRSRDALFVTVNDAVMAARCAVSSNSTIANESKGRMPDANVSMRNLKTAFNRS